MKTIICLLFLVGTQVNTPVQETITAVYDGPSDGIYYFTDSELNSFGFDEVAAPVAAKYDLDDDQYQGQTFRVTYIADTRTDEDEMDYEVYVITGLELVE
ncbi:hypothetical protein [Maribacter sp. 2307ULW6-5]|uniref:hypothetical protein n=1 Tax=Maribacter sp. 2307ULW6-5 TaxID=3386275 RepID=UPI0039BC9BC0